MPYASSLAVEQPYDARIPSQVASQSAPQQLLAPDQLDDLVAPIALYPDDLLGQMLAASTYPLEIVEAQQWLQQNGNLQGKALIEAARQQDWDPSVQMLVAFPDAMALLTRDIRWTTDLGNAFLAQQADVMNAIQALRAQARNKGRLETTPQQVVTTATQDGQSAIAIQPANPQVIYTPVYDPAYVWGAPAGGAYPAPAYYPDGYGPGGYGFGFGPGIDIAGLFSGLVGWGGWGWVLGWFTHTLSLASLFFNVLGFHGFGSGFNGAGGVGALAAWAHNPAHRLGVPYSNRIVAARYHGAGIGSARAPASRSVASASRPSGFAASGRSASDGWQHFGSSANFPARDSGVTRDSGNRGAVDERQRFGGGGSAFNASSSALGRAGSSTYRPGFASNGIASSQINSSRTNRGYASAMPERTASGFQSAASSRQFSSQASSHQAFAPQQHYSAPRASSPHFSSAHLSSPHVSGPRGSSHFSAPHHSGGGHSGKSSHKH